MKLSIVASMYLSAPFLREFCSRCSDVAARVAGDDWQIILVNDGSPDMSRQVSLDLMGDNPHILVVDLARNYGHHIAMWVGLSYADGERIFLLDCDLEEPPEVLECWWRRFDEESELDVIFGVQSSRKGQWLERVTGWFFYKIINALSKTQLATNSMVLRLMRKRYVDALVAFRDREMYLFGLMALAGFRQEAIPVMKSFKGSTSYSFFRKISLSINAITSFSNAPLYSIFYLGVTISFMAFLYISYLIIRAFFVSASPVPGWTSVFVSVWATGGLLLTALGVIGIYLAKIYSETKPRPMAIVRQVYRSIDVSDRNGATILK